MRAPYQYLLPLLSLFIARVDLTDIFPLRIPVRIIKIMDGDTLRVEGGGKIYKLRISRIDSAEKGQPFSNDPNSDAGMVAKKCLENVLAGMKDFHLLIEKRDIYGRTLGDIDGLSFKLVQNGCAGLYPYAQFSSKKEKLLYMTAYVNARHERKGVWKFGGYELPKNWRKKHKFVFKKRIALRQ
jgi:endonuclease YncB( thermonuclease family)